MIVIMVVIMVIVVVPMAVAPGTPAPALGDQKHDAEQNDEQGDDRYDLVGVAGRQDGIVVEKRIGVGGDLLIGGQTVCDLRSEEAAIVRTGPGRGAIAI